MESLKQKFKDSRRPFTSNEAVIASKSKYGRKRVVRHRELDDIDEIPRCKRTAVSFDLLFMLFE